MSATTLPLLKQWRLLEQEVVPLLMEAESRRGRARVWSVGGVSDAVAVAAAYRHARGDWPAGFEAFSTVPDGGHPDRIPYGFTLADIRAVPREARDEAFRRDDAHGWRVQPVLAARVLLGSPAGPVDLLTARTDPDGRPAVTGEMLDHLVPGGRLVLVGVPAAANPVDGLTAVGDTGLVFERAFSQEAHPSAGEVPAGPPESLADRMSQADLVLSHTNLARSLARRFAGHGEPRQDLDQVALLALVKAASRFDPERAVSFSTFATSTVLGELKRHFRDRTWMMRVPRPLQEAYLAVKDAREALTHELSTSPTIAQVAERLRISEERVLEAMEAGDNYWPESLDAGFAEDEAGRDVPVIDEGFDRALEHHELGNLLPRLAPRERLLLERLYIHGWTQRQAAQELGVSQMQVSRLLNSTLTKLRSWAR